MVLGDVLEAGLDIENVDVGQGVRGNPTCVYNHSPRLGYT